MTTEERNLRSIAGKCNGWYVCRPNALKSVYVIIDVDGEEMERFSSLETALTECSKREAI
jgi:hypothetical protein